MSTNDDGLDPTAAALQGSAGDAEGQPATGADAEHPLLDAIGLPDWFVDHLGSVVVVAVCVVVYLVLQRGAGILFKRNEALRFLAQRLLRWLGVPVVLLIVLQQLGVDMGQLWTVLTATLALIAIGFVAMWSLLSNISSAAAILSSGLFKVGDDVELMEPTASEGMRGKVVDLNLLFTTIEQDAADGVGRILTKVPNNVFAQKALRVRLGGAELPPQPSDDAGAKDENADA